MAWAQAESGSIRIATFAAPLSRDGPGLLLRDALEGGDPQLAAILTILNTTAPDILLLTDIDTDTQSTTLDAFQGQLNDPFPYVFSAMPNAGRQSGFDLDGDGYRGDARDAWGYGRFLGDGGMAILSRYPIRETGIRDLTQTPWREVPGAQLPVRDGQPFPSAKVQALHPVSSTAHWVVPIDVAGRTVTLLAFDATPPVFDGTEDANGLRNRDELRLWEAVLDGDFGQIPVAPVLIGNANIDPADGEGLQDGIRAVLLRPDLQDPRPASAGGRQDADPDHLGDPALDTVDWPAEGPGNLRVSYVLPFAAAEVTGAGVYWPLPDDPTSPLGADGLAAGPHRLVWVDFAISSLPERRE